ncbi:F-box protein pof6 [Schizosaccharomyces pombe]
MNAWDVTLSRKLYYESQDGMSQANMSSNTSKGFHLQSSDKKYADSDRPKLSSSSLLSLPDQKIPFPVDYSTVQGKQVVLTVLDCVSQRVEFARLDYIKVWRALAPIYRNLAYASNTIDPIAFSAFRTPEEQSKVLKYLIRFGNSYPYGTYRQAMQNAILDMASLFEQACLDEFELGLHSRNLDLLRRFSHVLHDFSGPNAYVSMYLAKQTDFVRSFFHFDPYSLFISNNLEEIHINWNILESVVNDTIKLLESESKFSEATLPEPELVQVPYAKDILGNSLKDYVISICEHIGEEETELFLVFISGFYGLCKKFFSIPNGPALVDTIFQPQIDIFISQELHYFKTVGWSLVDQWDQKLEEKEDATECFFYKNVSQNTAKNNFLETFKNVMLLPVSLFTIPSENNSASNLAEKAIEQKEEEDPELSKLDAARFVPANIYVSKDRLKHLPTTELAAQAAVLDSKLEGISTMFSLELALKIVHLCKVSLARAKVFMGTSVPQDDDIKGLSKDLFVQLLRELGQGHLKHGFDRAIEHLSSFDPRRDFSSNTVEPVVKFLELINVGDMIQQMMDSFFNEEMSPICVKDDMFDPAIAEKKKFEQLLDERAAFGLHKGINVLIEHADFLLETKTPMNLFSDQTIGSITNTIEPTAAAKNVVQFLGFHMRILVGRADREILDVFYKEVGMRLFDSLTRYIKSHKFSVDGGLKLLSDCNLYYEFIHSLHQSSLLPYFKTLKEVAHLFIIDGKNAEEIGKLATDTSRFSSAFHTEEVYEILHSRIDWLNIKYEVDKVIHGLACCIM